MRTPVIIMLGLLIILSTVACTTEPKSTASNYLRAWTKQDSLKMQSYVTNEAKQYVGTHCIIESRRIRIDDQKEEANESIVSYSYQEYVYRYDLVSTKSGMKTNVIKTSSTKGNWRKDKLVLIKEQGQWKVQLGVDIIAKAYLFANNINNWDAIYRISHPMTVEFLKKNKDNNQLNTHFSNPQYLSTEINNDMASVKFAYDYHKPTYSVPYAKQSSTAQDNEEQIEKREVTVLLERLDGRWVVMFETHDFVFGE